MKRPIRVLMVEDSVVDRDLILLELKRGGLEVEYEQVFTKETMSDALEHKEWDIILCDHKMPQFDSINALRLLKEKDLDIPFIIVSGTIGELIAVEAMRSGAHDYIMKDNMKRLTPAIARELEDAKVRAERRRAEQKLRHASSIMSKMFSTSHALMAYMDSDFNFLGVNKAYAAADGRQPDFFIGKNHFDLYPNEENESIFRSVVEKNESYTVYAKPFEYPDQPGRGASYWDWTLDPVKDTASGAVEGLLLTVLNVTERKLGEDEIIRQRDQLKNVMASLTHPFYVIDAKNYTVLQANPAANLGELTENSKCHALTHGSKTPCKDNENICPLEQVRNTGKPVTVEHIHYDKEGNKEIVEVHAYPIFDNSGKVVQMIEYDLDITDRKKAEEERVRLATAISQSAETVVITDTEGVIQYVNPAFERITGYTREEAIGHTPRLHKSGVHNQDFYKNLWDTIMDGKVWSGNIVNKKKNDDLYEEEATISPVFGSDGKIANFVAVKRDVTYEKRLQKARDYFTAVTSHELRTPVTKLQLAKMIAAEIAKELDEPGKMDKMLSILNESFDRLQSILSTTTMLSDLNLTQVKKDLHPVYLYADITTCIDTTNSLIKKTGRDVRLNVTLDDFPKDFQVKGDQDMIIKAIDSVLSNAVKYTPDGKSIKVTANMENDQAVLAISDEGIGISKENMELIFEPYFSLEDHLRHFTSEHAFKGGGLGLGLVLTRMIMEYHGGKLEVNSEGEDLGTVVTLTFPVAK